MTMTTSNRFEDRLLEQLRAIVAARPAPAIVSHGKPRRARFALAGGGAAAAAAVLVAIVAVSSEVTSSAYAVESRPDGAVTVSIHSLSDASGLQRSLRAAGIPAVVNYLSAGERNCAEPGPAGSLTGSEGDSGPGLSPGGGAEQRQAGDPKGLGPSMGKDKISIDGNGVTFTIDPDDIKPGEKLYITTSTGAISSIGMAIGKVNPSAPCATTGPTS
jgi:hypothetical protein